MADLILVMFIMHFLINKKVLLDKTYFLCVLFFFTYILITSVYYAPIFFDISISSRSFIVEIIKLLVLFIYFFVGSVLSKNGYINKLLMIYSHAAVYIGLIGIILSIVSIPAINEFMFEYGTRLNGFMNDPNYFAILQITALPYLFKETNSKKKSFSVFIILFSIILSGSKTGLLTLGVYLIFFFLENYILTNKIRTSKKIIRKLFLLGMLFSIIIIVINNFTSIIYWLNMHFPSSIRITSLFTDFESAISSGGSERDTAWRAGLEVIQASPIFGVGVANYTTVASKFLGVGIITHNTYIQLAAEWGLPLALLFFGSIITLIIYMIRNRNLGNKSSIQKDILIIFLIASIGISLNNARFFWLILGASYTLANNYNKET